MPKIFSLLNEKWLPVRRRSGGRSWIAPHQIVEDLDGDPVVRPDWGRADFDAATLEFLIGLLATACPPEDQEDWAERYRQPPSPGELAAAFASFGHAFALDGDGTRFMQEFGGLAGEAVPVSGLFIEAPGANTEKNNADLFQKRGRLVVLGLPAAAIALFTLQTYAPLGGAGHRTSLRGGGPLTTLAVPKGRETLWHRLWPNVPEAREPLPADLSRVFPWLASTRTSEGKAPPLTDDDIDPRGVFWGMPRRIWLETGSEDPDVFCALTGETAAVTVRGYRTRPRGMNYGAILHPLSPMYRLKIGGEWLYLHPQPGGLSYRHWIDIAMEGGASALKRPAPAVLDARERFRNLSGADRESLLWAAGYDMDNMKARGFVEAMFPFFLTKHLDDHARALVAAAQETCRLTAGAIKDARNLESSDASALAAVREDFYARTQVRFFDATERLDALLTGGGALSEGLPPISRAFLDTALRPAALQLFDLHAPWTVFSRDRKSRGGGETESENPIIAARLRLTLALNGYGKDGKALFNNLGLPLPEKAEPRRAGRKQEVVA